SIDFRDAPKVGALVERSSLKRYRERLEDAGRSLGRVMQDCGRVQTSARPHTQRYVGDQMLTRCTPQQRVELFRGFGGRPRTRPEFQFPIRFKGAQAIPPFKKVPGRKLLDALGESIWAGHVIKHQEVVQPGQIERPGNLAMSENRLQFGPEVDIGASPV